MISERQIIRARDDAVCKRSIDLGCRDIKRVDIYTPYVFFHQMFLKVIEQHTFAATDLQYALKRDLRQQFPHPMKEVLGKVYGDTITTVVFRIPTKVRWFCHV